MPSKKYPKIIILQDWKSKTKTWLSEPELPEFLTLQWI